MVELLVRCTCGHILDMKESYGRLGEVVLIVESCWNCIDIAKDKGYEEGAIDGFAQHKEEKNDVKIIVEYDGMQHFSPVRFGGISLYRAKKKLERQQEIDNLDFKFCIENNIILRRIRYDENKEKLITGFKRQIDEL